MCRSHTVGFELWAWDGDNALWKCCSIGLSGKRTTWEKSDLATDTGPEQDQSSDLRQITRKWHRQSANCKEDTQDRE